MFNKIFHLWIEKYFYRPKYFEVIISMVLSPLALIYYALIILKFKYTKKIKFSTPIVSVGNLVVGGTGKTPLTKAIFTKYSGEFKTFIVLRGYKRSSRGLLEVALNAELLCDIENSGDEAMEYALSLKNANVIVSENRILGIKRAIKRGAELIILDDGFGKFNIDKFDILLKPALEPIFNTLLPSGAYRYPKSFYKFANFIPSKDDIIHFNWISNATKNMILVTAIANPFRLKSIFRHCKGLEFFEDHHKFRKKEIENIFRKYNATSILVTRKDYVKLKDFGFNLSILELNTEISENFKKKLDSYIENYKNMLK